MRPAPAPALAAVAVLALAAAPLLAQLPKTVPGAPDPSRVPAGTYAIDPDHTQVLFTVNHLGFSEYTGQFTQPSGSVTIDPKNAANDTVDVTFPIDKVLTTTPALDKHMQSADFFDAAKFPDGKFVSSRVVVKGLTATIAGNLTLHGITKPVVLNARFIGAGPMVMGPPTLNFGFRATTSVKRSDFGMAFGIPLVSDKVDLVINASFKAK